MLNVTFWTPSSHGSVVRLEPGVRVEEAVATFPVVLEAVTVGVGGAGGGAGTGGGKGQASFGQAVAGKGPILLYETCAVV